MCLYLDHLCYGCYQAVLDLPRKAYERWSSHFTADKSAALYRKAMFDVLTPTQRLVVSYMPFDADASFPYDGMFLPPSYPEIGG